MLDPISALALACVIVSGMPPDSELFPLDTNNDHPF